MGEEQKLEFPNVKSNVWEIRGCIYILSILFSPMGFLVGIYLITHTDKEYKEIGANIIQQLTLIILIIIFAMWFIPWFW